MFFISRNICIKIGSCNSNSVHALKGELTVCKERARTTESPTVLPLTTVNKQKPKAVST